MIKKLPHTKLKKFYDPNKLKFNDTSEVEPLYDVIGQERAVEAIEFGLKIKLRGYNIYLSGSTGTGKTSYAVNYIKSIAKKQQVPDDWCYVYNFEKPNNPIAVNLPAGKGKDFQKDIEEFVKFIEQEIPKVFDSEDYEREKSRISSEFQIKRNKLLENLDKDAEKRGFKVKTTSTGIYFLPIIDGKIVTEEEYETLEESQKYEIDGKSNKIQMETMEHIRKLKNLEKVVEEKIEKWEDKIVLFAIGMQIEDLKSKYAKYEKIVKYLCDIQEDILDNIELFKEEEGYENQPQLLLPFVKKNEESPAEKYTVNLVVDNSEQNGKPVIDDYNPTFYNLVGKFEYENEFGTMTTDYTMIKGGLFHQANGGYLILQVKDLLNNVQAWESLKRTLRTRQIVIENMKEQMGLVAISALKPEHIPLDIKVILVGSENVYQLLYEHDEEFRKLFKIKADFDDEIELNIKHVDKLCRFISSFCRRENTKHFDKTGVAKIIEYCSRLVEDQEKVSTKFNDIVEILCESSAYAEINKSDIVKDIHVKEAIEKKSFRSNKYDKKILELMDEGTILINTSGEKVGELNGLTIIDTGEFVFGKPSKITANTYIGENGIINIEREVEMSGTSHSKGVLILSGYIGENFAQKMPLTLSASLCFEQLYGGIDGDSASSAELYAIISSLSEVPIKQGVAVTGSINQKGEIQPIGGVTQKIEGFFELCSKRGLDGTQGVIIPHQNIKNLVLNDDVIQAVKNEKFSIYAIKTIQEGLEILTGVKAGKKNKNGNYPKSTVLGLAYEKLEKYSKIVEDISK